MNNETTNFADWSTEKLINESKHYKQILKYVSHGSNDTYNSVGINQELINRGINL